MSAVICSVVEIEEEEQRTEVSSQNIQVISSPAPTDGCDQNKWVDSFQQKLDSIPQLDKKEWSRYSIFRVPRNLRKMELQAYTPQFVSIGPLHRRKRHLQFMQTNKWRFLRRCLERTHGTNTRQGLEDYIKAILPDMKQARGCYALQTDKMEDKEFIEMMLLDSCFILELLLTVVPGVILENEPLFAARAIVPGIRRDMLLLENQIPLFVLDKLFEITAAAEPVYWGDSVSQLAHFFFNTTVPGNINNQRTPNTGNEDEKGLHLLHVIRQSLVTLPLTRCTSSSPHPLNASYRPPHLMMRSASTLVDSGVIFEKRKLKNCKLTDIEFRGGVLKIPLLLVDDATKSIFLNLMAFEQCYPYCSDQISAYVVFMDGLINTPQDVAYLQQRGIIHHQLGSEKAVAKLFNELCREISIDHMDGSYIFKLSSELDDYVLRKWPSWRTSLRREYLRHPWAIMSVAAAVLIIGLTLTQTLYAILAYYS